MVAVRTIFVRIVTGRADSDGDVYLGIGGTEFIIDSKDPDINDFEEDSDRTYWMGEVPPLVPPDSQENRGNPFLNNPLKPYQLFTENLDKFPVYIRFDETDHSIFGVVLGWIVKRVEVRVNPVGNTQDKKYIDPAAVPRDSDEYFLSRKNWSKFLFLKSA